MDFYLNWHNNKNMGTSETLALAGASKIDALIEAFTFYKKHNVTIPSCK